MSDADGESTEAGPSARKVRLLIAGGLALAAGVLFWMGRPKQVPAPEIQARTPMPTRLKPEALSETEAEREATTLQGTYRRDVARPKPVQDNADPFPGGGDPSLAGAPGSPSSRRRDEKKSLPEIFRMPPEVRSAPVAGRAPQAGESEKAARAALGDAFAPFGRLVKCQLIDTVDSVTARSEPIVALVTEDLDWNGSVIIPAGTEAFSYARPEPVIDAAGVGRLVDGGEWTLVLPGSPGGANGRELILKARAIDRRELVLTDQGRVRAWGIDDGADGLIGYTLSTLDNREIKLFAAAAISGMAQGFGAIAERQQPAAGLPGTLGATQAAPTLGNAAVGSLGAGAVDYMNQLAARIRDEIAKRGVYVRVPSGKEFYLFVEQTIDPGAASIGLRLPAAVAAPR
jgi:hypothetical protein